MLYRSLRVVVSPFVIPLFAGALAVGACGGSTSRVGATANDAGVDGSGSSAGDSGGGTGTGDDGGTPSGGDDGSIGPSDDAGIDGEVVTEGGSNPNLDGGDDDGGDTLPDGGACNAIDDTSAAVTSTCASVEPILGGGALVAGTYHLVSVTTYGTAAFCKSDFIPVGIKEMLVMTVNAGVGSVDTASQLATTKERHASETLTPGANNATPLTEQTTCPVTAAAATIPYTAAATAAKTSLTLRLPYGKDEADYVFEKQ